MLATAGKEDEVAVRVKDGAPNVLDDDANAWPVGHLGVPVTVAVPVARSTATVK